MESSFENMLDDVLEVVGYSYLVHYNNFEKKHFCFHRDDQSFYFGTDESVKPTHPITSGNSDMQARMRMYSLLKQKELAKQNG